jgi:hypothetical protein
MAIIAPTIRDRHGYLKKDDQRQIINMNLLFYGLPALEKVN